MATISFRTDPEVDEALELLTDGQPRRRSRAIRDALLQVYHQRQAEQLRDESATLAADPTDAAEARAVLADMEPLRAW